MKKVIFLSITIVVIACCVFFARRGMNGWRYAAAQSHINIINYGAENYIKKQGKHPTKIEDLVTSKIITQEQLNTCLSDNIPVKILSINDGEYLIKYQHPLKTEKFFGVKMNGEPKSGLIQKK